MLSGSTRRHDRNQKREFYRDVGVAEYWIVDPERGCVRVVRRGEEDVVTSDRLDWHPAGASRPLELDVRTIFKPQDGA
jgi:Uma2 family endonuclease